MVPPPARRRLRHWSDRPRNPCFAGRAPRADRWCAHLAQRVIPARAGVGVKITVPAGYRLGHPCARGSRHQAQPAGKDLEGSSLRARESVWEKGFTPSEDGVIPARAGVGDVVALRRKSVVGHPCARGSRLPTYCDPPPGFGSSLRARESVIPLTPLPLRVGVIPARAGVGQEGVAIMKPR